MKVTKQDLELEFPTSLREIVEDEISAGDIKPPEDGIEALMQRVFSHIERQALQVYKSNAPWALRRWALENILKEEVVSEAIVDIADGLIAPVLSWQKEQPLDPLVHYEHRLTNTLRLRPETVRAYMITASRFVGKFGRKTHYSDEEVLEYLDWAGGHFPQKGSSFIHECYRLQQFLRNLPGANPEYKLPIEVRKLDEVEGWRQPMLSDEEVEKICWATVLDRIRPNMVVRIAVASIYGGRKSELAQLSSEDIYLDGDKSHIYIRTAKRGTKKQQPIPPSLIPLFSPTIEPITAPTLHNRLKRIVKRAEVPWVYGMGFHSFRRNVVTLIDKISQSDLDKSKFMRWSTPRQLGMLDRYRQKPTEVSDMAILSEHPRVKLWQDIIPYLAQFNPYYHSQIDILT
jgi:hypothetical protein